eukprot:TRINITY_DN62318_c0_g1_i1.p1 TRINITY_DN62318_c0_g1~~TRINITY_DN62318_c0_g1_i1.p1  ORF type:complete len:311 (+),score=42.56 TRINITY_DN62318_c0_g1_i1:99-1031(+)
MMPLARFQRSSCGSQRTAFQAPHSMLEGLSLRNTSNKGLRRSDSASSQCLSGAIADAAEKAGVLQERLALELAALTGIACEVEAYMAFSHPEKRDPEPVHARSFSPTSTARSMATNSTCLSSEPLEGEAAEGRRPCAPVGARHRKFLPQAGNCLDTQFMLEALQKTADRCIMALDHTEALLESVRRAADSWCSTASCLSEPTRQAALKHEVQLHKQLCTRLEENEAICQESAKLGLKALRCTSAGCYEPPRRVVPLPAPPSLHVPSPGSPAATTLATAAACETVAHVGRMVRIVEDQDPPVRSARLASSR